MNSITLAKAIEGQDVTKSSLKLRYLDWNHTIKFFQVQKVCLKTRKVSGILDNAQEVEFDLDSDFWQYYEEGLEDQIRVV